MKLTKEMTIEKYVKINLQIVYENNSASYRQNKQDYNNNKNENTMIFLEFFE
jgi:hypothetical protein